MELFWEGLYSCAGGGREKERKREREKERKREREKERKKDGIVSICV